MSTEQEYDAHADMLDDENPSDRDVGPGPYPQTHHHHHQPFSPQHQIPMGVQGQPPTQQMHPMQQMQPMQLMQPPSTSQTMDPNNQAYSGIQHAFDPYDPMLDADPFGLSASMHFPTQFTFQESSMRR